MNLRLKALTFLLLASLPLTSVLYAQFYTLETDNLRLVYTSALQSYLVPQVARSFENSLRFHRAIFDYTPPGKMNVLMHDLWHYGNAGAFPLPQNNITVGIAPHRHVYEANPGTERMASYMNHEMVHIVTTDKASSADRFFRTLFFGKVTPIPEEPVSMVYSYLTTPRLYTPRWALEGIAVYFETWMNGGLGRVIGAYDEMVFRTMVRDNSRVYDVVGLESEGTTIDFQVGVNSYLYGTRFVCYLAHQYGNEKLIRWFNRTEDSKRYFTAQFKHVYGVSLDEEWARWIAWEHQWQQANLDAIRQHPTTAYRPLSDRALGSVSRAFLDAATRKLYVAVRYPGQVAHIAAIDVVTGHLEKISDIIGAGAFYVTSLAYDASSGTLFYTTNNNGWPNLVALNLRTGTSKTLIKEARVGDLAFNPGDKSLWGVRHDNGNSTLVRIPAPYSEWNQIYTLPYGRDMFDLDLSLDGSTLIASMAEINGKQRLVKMDVEALLDDDTAHEVLFDFGDWEPSNFVFSPDGRHLFGSSYYSGVSNIYRYDIGNERMEVLSNAETGFFRPLPVSDDSLIVFRYTGQGFVPSMIPNQVPEFVSAITFLGNEIAKKEPVVRSWVLPSSTLINLDSLTHSTGDYHALRQIRLNSAYPIVEGYEDANGVNAAAFGMRFNLSDRIGISWLDASVSYSPDTALDADERLHAALRFRHWGWQLKATYNRADVYDLFGPTKTSRKGYSLALQYRDNLLFDDPKTLDYTLGLAGYGGLETVPEYQNVAASYDELLAFEAGLEYSFLRRSLGAVEDELGVRADVILRGNYVEAGLFPRLHADLELGFLLPINHSSLWLRGAAGQSFASDRDDPFANFFFGGYGNNWVDYLSVKRFRDTESFPGVGINDVGGANFGKVQVEWVLPPLRFRRVGVPSLYLRWASLSLFATGIVTNLDREALRRTLVNVGGQLDFRLVTLSLLKSTLSIGYAVAAEEGRSLRKEVLLSLKIM